MTAVHEDQNVQKAEVQTATAVHRPSRGDWRRRACRCHNIGEKNTRWPQGRARHR